MGLINQVNANDLGHHLVATHHRSQLFIAVHMPRNVSGVLHSPLKLRHAVRFGQVVSSQKGPGSWMLGFIPVWHEAVWKSCESTILVCYQQNRHVFDGKRACKRSTVALWHDITTVRRNWGNPIAHWKENECDFAQFHGDSTKTPLLMTPLLIDEQRSNGWLMIGDDTNQSSGLSQSMGNLVLNQAVLNRRCCTFGALLKWLKSE